MNEGAGRTGRGGRTISDRVLAAAGAVMIAAALYLVVFGGPDDSATPLPIDAPVVELREPQPDGVVAGPVELVFQSSRPLSPQPGGWGADGLHLHASLDGREIMPGTADIRRGDGNLYRWTLPSISPGRHAVSLFWSDASHRPLPETGTSLVPFTIR